MPDPRQLLLRQMLRSDTSPSCTVSTRARRRHVAGFTLVELLTVVVVLALLLGLVLGAVGPARAFSQRLSCLNSLREIGMMTQAYVTDHDFYPAAYDDKTTPGHLIRWMDRLKPYMNKKSKLYRCPNDQDAVPLSWDPEITLSYGMNVWNFHNDKATCFWYATPKRGRYGGVNSYDVRHPGQVILFANCTSGNYYCGSGATFRDPVPYVAYRHLNGTFNAVYCDGHAESRTDTTQADWDAAQ